MEPIEVVGLRDPRRGQGVSCCGRYVSMRQEKCTVTSSLTMSGPLLESNPQEILVYFQ